MRSAIFRSHAPNGRTSPRLGGEVEVRAAPGSPTSLTTCHTPKPMTVCANLGLRNVQLAYDGLQFDVRVDAPPTSRRRTPPARVFPPRLPRVSRKLKRSRPPFWPFISPEQWAAHYAASGRRQHSRHRQFRWHSPRPPGHPPRRRRARRENKRRRHRAHLRSLSAQSPPPGIRSPAPFHQRAAHGLVRHRRPRSRRSPSLYARSRAPLARRIRRAILVRGLHVRAVLVGENFRFGHKQAGDVAQLRELGARYGFAVEIIPPVSFEERNRVQHCNSPRNRHRKRDPCRSSPPAGPSS